MRKTLIKITALALIAVMMCAVLVSCAAPNKDPEKAKEALEEAGYVVVLNDGGALGDHFLPKGVEASLSAFKGDDEFIVIAYYESAEALNEDWDDAKDDANEYADKYEDIVCKKSGKMIFIGTKQAIKDAK